jgi:hypothetical protein
MTAGVLLEVQARSLIEAESVTLRDDRGQLFTFRVDPEVMTNRDAPQTASHLRQHMALADPCWCATGPPLRASSRCVSSMLSSQIAAIRVRPIGPDDYRTRRTRHDA